MNKNQLSDSQMLLEAREAASRVEEILKSTTATNQFRAAGQKLRDCNSAFVATIARGSSDHVANFASYLIPLATGRLVASIAPSITTVLKAKMKLAGQAVIAISQSGSSPDLIENLNNARAAGALTIAVVNNENSEMARAAEIVIPQMAGSEVSVAATKTVLCSMVALTKLVAEWSEDPSLHASLEKLPEQMRDACALGEKIDAKLLDGVTEAFIISRALGESAAREIALKLKETCGIHAEGFSSAEVRHGPREIVGPRLLILALALPGAGEEEIANTALELANQGAKVLIFAPKAGGRANFIELPYCEDLRVAPILCLQMLFPWIARAAAALGRNPDQPRNLPSKIVKTF